MVDILGNVAIEQSSRRFDWMACPINLVSSPCDSCEQELRCKQEQLACERFLNYVELGDEYEVKKGGNDEPNRNLYIRVFLNKNEKSLAESEMIEINQLNKLRGVNHKMIADQFYLLPDMVRKIVGAV